MCHSGVKCMGLLDKKFGQIQKEEDLRNIYIDKVGIEYRAKKEKKR